MSENPTPLEPLLFFAGRWKGEGELRPAWWLRQLEPVRPVRLSSVTTPLSASSWRVDETFEIARRPSIERRMIVEIVGPVLLRVTAADMPGGADVHLSRSGFDFSSYRIQVKQFGLPLRLRCNDVNRIGADGLIRDRIRMSLLGLHVATMELIVDRRPD